MKQHLSNDKLNEIELEKKRAELNSRGSKNEFSKKPLLEPYLRLQNLSDLKVARYSETWFRELKEVLSKYDSVSKKINEVEETLEENPQLDSERVRILFSKVKTQWRTLIDDGFTVYHMAFDPSEIDNIPEVSRLTFTEAFLNKDKKALSRLRN